jgi:hypothetical protein
LPLEDGICRLSVTNNQSMLRNIQEEQRSQITVLFVADWLG